MTSQSRSLFVEQVGEEGLASWRRRAGKGKGKGWQGSVIGGKLQTQLFDHELHELGAPTSSPKLFCSRSNLSLSLSLSLSPFAPPLLSGHRRGLTGSRFRRVSPRATGRAQAQAQQFLLSSRSAQLSSARRCLVNRSGKLALALALALAFLLCQGCYS